MYRPIARTFALSVFVMLAACSSGGSVLSLTNNPKPDHTIITVNGPVNIARVLPGGSLALSAISVSGSQNGILSNNRYVWDAHVTTGQSYVADASGTMRPCASVMQTTGTTTTPFTGDFSINITIDPTNESNVIFTAPVVITPPAGSTITTNYPYCVTITAQPGTVSGTTFTRNGPPGSLTIAVVDPQNPLQ